MTGVCSLIVQRRVGEECVFLEMDQLGCEQILLAIAKRFRCKLWVQNAARAAAMRLVKVGAAFAFAHRMMMYRRLHAGCVIAV